MKVVVTRKLPDSVEAGLAERFEAELNPADDPFSRGRLEEAMGRCDVLAPSVRDRIDSALIAAAGERLRLIANFGAGTDNIDLDAARARGIAVTNTPDVLTEDTADLAMALILIGPRRLGEGERNLRSGRWRGWGPTDQLGRSLTAKALGIVGMGRIGGALARRARAFGMEVHYHNRRPVPGEQARYWPDLDAMLPEMDVVSLNTPYGPETHHLIGRRRLGLMRQGAWLINTARGGLVDEEALIEALAAGAIAGAGLDVYPAEPEVDPRLLDLPNLVLLPHLGSATLESRTAMGEKVLANIIAFAEGRELPDRVV
ncbi:MAG TPA: D-glycerate dehydrogenase [Allosphingosinicella sp.]|nr:D-glycerate dehydrogenase [Allosphingosinicella sp.]